MKLSDDTDLSVLGLLRGADCALNTCTNFWAPAASDPSDPLLLLAGARCSPQLTHSLCQGLQPQPPAATPRVFPNRVGQVFVFSLLRFQGGKTWLLQDARAFYAHFNVSIDTRCPSSSEKLFPQKTVVFGKREKQNTTTLSLKTTGHQQIHPFWGTK